MNHTIPSPLKLIAVMIAATVFTAACSSTATKVSADPEPAATLTQPVTTTEPDTMPVASSTDEGTLNNTETSSTEVDTQSDNTVASTDSDTASPAPAVADSSDTSATLQTPVATDDTASRPALTTFNFGFNQTKLDDDSLKMLKQHGRFLAQHPNMKVTINGYSDSQGDSKYNDALSLKRADYVESLLLSQGAQKDQVEVYGWGSSSPLPGKHSNRDNRRVELKYSDGYVAQSSN